MRESTLAGLVGPAQSGDAQALNRLLSGLRPMALRLARGRVNDPGLAEDAAQEVMVRLVSQLTRLRRPGAIERWLTWMVANECRRVRRLEARWRAGQRVVPPTGGVASSAGRQRDHDQHRAEVQVAVERLPPAQRLVAALVLGGYSISETAHLLGISAGAARKRIHDARNGLRQGLGARAAQLVRELAASGPTGLPGSDNRVTMGRQAPLRLAGTIAVGPHPSGVACDPDTRSIYVACEAVGEPNGWLSILAAEPLDAVGRLPLERRPRVLALDPALRRLFITHYTACCLSVVDLDSMQVVGRAALPGNPVAMDVDRQTHLGYVTTLADGTYGGQLAGLVVVDCAVGAVRAAIPLGDQRSASMGPPFVRVAQGSGTAVVSRGGYVAFVTGWGLTRTVPLAAERVADLTIDESAGRFYVAPYLQFTLISGPLGTGATDCVIALEQPAMGLACDSGTSRVFVGHSHSGSITVVDGRSAGDLAAIACTPSVPGTVGTSGGIVYDAASRRLLATSQAIGMLYVLEYGDQLPTPPSMAGTVPR
jgi:RNA polymerase sigma factor (sigma-70 family)